MRDCDNGSMRATGPRSSGRSRRLGAGLVLGVALALSFPAAATGAPGDWTRWKFDAANTGVNPYETRLGPGNVRGLRRTSFLDQWCVGTPLVAGGTVYIGATDPGLEGPGAVMALDAGTGRVRWRSYVTRTTAATGPVAVAGAWRTWPAAATASSWPRTSATA